MITMWFRRKNKGDADSELTDTLVSLQSLLDEKTPDSPDTGPVAHNSASPRDSEDTVERTAKVNPRGKNIKNAVASEEHLEWDFKVDMAGDEALDRASGRAFLKAVASDEVGNLEAPDGGAVIPLRRGGGSVTDSPPGKPGPDVDDNIPVLNKIVYLPGRDGPAHVGFSRDRKEALFVDQCLKDIDNRLEHSELTPLTPNQKQQLGTALTSLLIQKTSGKFE